MAFEISNEEMKVSGEVSVEEVEALIEQLNQLQEEIGTRPVKVDLSECVHMHTAAVQVLMHRGCEVSKWPAPTEWVSWMQAGLER